MTQKNQLKFRLQTLKKIGSIMTAMRNLSFIEMTKVSKFLITQDQIQSLILQMGNDFVTNYPEFQLQFQHGKPELFVLIGSERGFCANFNDTLVEHLEKNNETTCLSNVELILVGRKLSEKMGDDKRVIHRLDGPNAIEEISDTIFDLISALNLFPTKLRPGSWSIIFNQKINESVQTVERTPYFELITKKPDAIMAPCTINITPRRFLSEFMNQYLFFLFYLLFFQSFYAENYYRSNHLQNALNHLEKKERSLKRKVNLLRQEEITQEIQIILLSIEALLQETHLCQG